MANVIIVERLKNEILKKFGGESNDVFGLMHTLKDNPKKGKSLGNVGKIVIKELKYKSHRFYFIADGFKIKFMGVDSLRHLIIRFVRMSDKKSQQKTINEIKHILKNMGEEGF